MVTSGTLALLLLMLTAGPIPNEADIKACEKQAQAAAGTPAVSPRSQPNSAQPSDDTQPQARSEGPAPRRATPAPPQQDVEARSTPPMPDADGGDAYRAALHACLTARAR
jgi:hypothetical protein